MLIFYLDKIQKLKILFLLNKEIIKLLILLYFGKKCLKKKNNHIKIYLIKTKWNIKKNLNNIKKENIKKKNNNNRKLVEKK